MVRNEHNRLLTQEFARRKQQYEYAIADFINRSGDGSCVHAPFEWDVKHHIDLILTTPNGGKVYIDVKCPRKTFRSNYRETTDVCVEYRNVLGKAGWLCGKADVILQLCGGLDRAILLLRQNLLAATRDLFERALADTSSWLHTNPGVNPGRCFVPFSRKGNDDLIMFIPQEFALRHAAYLREPLVFPQDLTRQLRAIQSAEPNE